MTNEIIDVAIIGAGSAGLAAAQYAARANLKTVIFEKMGSGGQCLLIDNLENYPGILSINGFEFSSQMQAQATNFGAKFIIKDIHKITREASGIFSLETNSGVYRSKTVIAATGAHHKMLMVPGEERLIGHGVSYCATCDGPFFRNKRILVVGGGDAACDEATFLSKLTPHISMIHRRDSFRAQKAVAQRVIDNPNINIIWNTELKEIHGESAVQSVSFYHNDTRTSSTMEIDAVFIFIGSNPQSELFTMAERDEMGYLATDTQMSTSVPGLFAIGDVRNTPFRQIVTACADGAIAANAASHYIDDMASKF